MLSLDGGAFDDHSGVVATDDRGQYLSLAFGIHWQKPSAKIAFGPEEVVEQKLSGWRVQLQCLNGGALHKLLSEQGR